MMLSPHFALAEATASQTAARLGLDNTPPDWVIENMRKQAALLEQVRTLLGNRPVLISSWYRGPEVNAAVNGSKNSAHMIGWATDFTCPGYGTPKQICEAIRDSDLPFDQLIYEFASWVHLGGGPGSRRQVLTINRNGTFVGIVD